MEYKTADLCDANRPIVTILEPIGFKDFGSRKMFSGQIETVKCFEDHAPVELMLSMDGKGKVLVVDGGGSLRCALTGDRLAGIAVSNNWNGIVINGCVRDAAGLAMLDLGVKALGTYPISQVTNIDWETNIAIHFAGTTIQPGHYIYCDEDGIIVAATPLKA